MTLSRLEALDLAQKAFAEGEARGVVKMSVVVTDAGGHVRVAMRGDGQGIFGVETATAKAVTALGFNRPTLALAPAFSPQATAALSGATGGRFAPLGGGVVMSGPKRRQRHFHVGLTNRTWTLTGFVLNITNDQTPVTEQANGSLNGFDAPPNGIFGVTWVHVSALPEARTYAFKLAYHY